MKSFLRSFSSLPLNHSRRVVVSYKQKYVHVIQVLVNRLFKLAQEKSVVSITAMTIAVDLGCKSNKTNKKPPTQRHFKFYVTSNCPSKKVQ